MTNSNSRTPSARKNAESTGPIEPGKLYAVTDFLARVSWGQWAFRSARRAGLKVIRTGGHAYVLGDDALEYFKGLSAGTGTTANA